LEDAINEDNQSSQSIALATFVLFGRRVWPQWLTRQRENYTKKGKPGYTVEEKETIYSELKKKREHTRLKNNWGSL